MWSEMLVGDDANIDERIAGENVEQLFGVDTKWVVYAEEMVCLWCLHRK